MRDMLRTPEQVPFVKIMFHCEGMKWPCYVSPRFAEEHGLDVSSEHIEVFEDQPWVASLGGFCEKCFVLRTKKEQPGTPE